MLEIYNETIRDLLSTNRPSLDMSRSENGIVGKQYTIKHDANGNTHVSDLTIADVRSSREVSFLLDQAAQSRYSTLYDPLHTACLIFPIKTRFHKYQQLA